jgi:DNA-binding XRE family transcriptional regulator
MKQINETCERCGGWVWHRHVACNCKAVVVSSPSDHPDYLGLIGKRLRTLRMARGWSLDTLAAKVGMSKTGLWQIEKGRSEPMARTLVSLANALNVTIDYLLMRRPT